MGALFKTQRLLDQLHLADQVLKTLFEKQTEAQEQTIDDNKGLTKSQSQTIYAIK